MTTIWVWPLLHVIWGHMRSNAFLPLTIDWIELEPLGWSQCFSLTESHQLIFNMSYLDHHVASHQLDLRPLFDLDLIMSTRIYVSTCLDDRNTIEYEYFARHLSSKVIWGKTWPFRPILTSLPYPIGYWKAGIETLANKNILRLNVLHGFKKGIIIKFSKKMLEIKRVDFT